MISTHILDTGLGLPADHVKVVLEMQDGLNWLVLKQGETNHDGRMSFDITREPGVYRLTFSIEDYFKRTHRESFFVATPVAFHIKDTQRNYHVPLLLNSYGYSTYRGS